MKEEHRGEGKVEAQSTNTEPVFGPGDREIKDPFEVLLLERLLPFRETIERKLKFAPDLDLLKAKELLDEALALVGETKNLEEGDAMREEAMKRLSDLTVLIATFLSNSVDEEVRALVKRLAPSKGMKSGDKNFPEGPFTFIAPENPQTLH